jgi:hypothetical protein
MKRCILCYVWPVSLVDDTPYCALHWLKATDHVLDEGAGAVVTKPTRRTLLLADVGDAIKSALRRPPGKPWE